MAVLAEHQRVAALRAVELLERRGAVVLADQTGLGKSFVAAEVIRVSRLQTVLVIPAGLSEQWRATLHEFEIEARVLSHDALARERLMPGTDGRLVVVDEAHAFRNPKTLRHAALARATAGARVMLVTATPFCNTAVDVETLIRLIARDDLLADEGIPSIDAAFRSRDAEGLRRIIGCLVIRRDRDVLPDELRFGELERRVIRHPVLDAPEIDELRFPLVEGHALLRRFLLRRLESSEAALIESVRRQLRFYERALAAMSHGRTLPKRDYRRAFGHDEDREAVQEVLFWELFAPAGASAPGEIRREIDWLERLRLRAAGSSCVKRGLLLDEAARDSAPMLIFTTSAATARDLGGALGAVRRPGVVTARQSNRRQVIEDFRRGVIDVLVSTDLGAEGLDLQIAGTVVHYDIPWNPVKLDQRNGRAYRIGQKRNRVRAIYFLPLARRSGIIEAIARKTRERKRFLEPGDSAGPIQPVRTLRQRVTGDAAFLELRRATDLPLDAVLERRHKSGIELIMREMAGEYLDGGRLADLVELVRRER